MTFDEWASRWNLPPQCLYELTCVTVELAIPEGVKGDGRSESYVASERRLVLSKLGVIPLRNNVGVLQDINGRPVRYGLANETPAMNKILKSGDDIAIIPYVVTARDVGRRLGVFGSFEDKKADWRYTGKGRETAQDNWRQFVQRQGGFAMFVTKGQDVIDSLNNAGLLSQDQLQGLT